jgi:hypothetical protein
LFHPGVKIFSSTDWISLSDKPYSFIKRVAIQKEGCYSDICYSDIIFMWASITRSPIELYLDVTI